MLNSCWIIYTVPSNESDNRDKTGNQLQEQHNQQRIAIAYNVDQTGRLGSLEISLITNETYNQYIPVHKLIKSQDL